jgi:hypothetical protein
MESAVCDHCHAHFNAKTIRRRFRSAKCRKPHWTRQREDRETRMREQVKALAKQMGLTAKDFSGAGDSP